MTTDNDSPSEEQQPYKVGDAVQVEWYGGWYAADVLAVRKTTVRIHYRGWGDNWDETVPLSRVRRPKEGEQQHAGPFPAQSRSFGKPPTTAATGRPVSASTPLKVGDRLLGEWAGYWWAAEVVALDGALVRVHWDGWDSSWDETVARSRLRIDAPGPWEALHGKPVRVHLDGGVVLDGTLVEEAPDYLLLSRSSDGKRLLVNRTRLLYCESGG